MDQFDVLTNFILIYDQNKSSGSFGFENSQEKIGWRESHHEQKHKFSWCQMSYIGSYIGSLAMVKSFGQSG